MSENNEEVKDETIQPVEVNGCALIIMGLFFIFVGSSLSWAFFGIFREAGWRIIYDLGLTKQRSLESSAVWTLFSLIFGATPGLLTIGSGIYHLGQKKEKKD